MLHARIILALACIAVFPVSQAMAESETTSTPSGTTTYFGGHGETTPKAASETPKPKVHLAPTVVASVDLANQRMVVSVNGESRYSWPISSGVAQFPTPTGTFHPQWTSKMWYSRKYDMSPMPHAVFIHGGVAVHGTYHTRYLGHPASHGCIRLSTAHAKTFYDLVQKHGLARTKVTVFGRPPWHEPAIASRKSRDRDYAENDDNGGNNGFWGNFWSGGNAGYYDTQEAARRRAYRRRNGDYSYERRPRQRSYYRAYGYGYGSYYDGY